MIPASAVWVWRWWRLMMLMPWMVTRPVLGNTRSTFPRLPLSSPEITCTLSPLVTCSRIRTGACRRTRLAFLYTSGFMLQHLRRQRDDLHIALLAELAGHRPENAGRPGLARVVDQYRRVLVEPDIGAVLAPGLLGGSHDDGLGHIAFLYLPRGDGVLDGDHHGIAQPGVAPFAPAEHPDHQGSPSAGVVGDAEDGFLLDHWILVRAISYRLSAISYAISE